MSFKMNKLFANIHNQSKISNKLQSQVSQAENYKLFQRTDSRVLRSTENDDARAGKAFEYLTER